MKRVPFIVRLPEREHAMLKVCAKAYRAPSLNWFVGEMIACMLNPARWQEFSLRLNSGTVQQTLDLGQSLLQERSRPVRTSGGTRSRGKGRGRTAGTKKRKRRV